MTPDMVTAFTGLGASFIIMITGFITYRSNKVKSNSNIESMTFNDLSKRLDEKDKAVTVLIEKVARLEAQIASYGTIENELKKLQEKNRVLKSDYFKLQEKYNDLKDKFDILQASYDLIKENIKNDSTSNN